MLKLILIFFFAIFIWVNSLAQVSVYKPFPESSGTWKVRIGNGSTIPWTSSEVIYYITGIDTLIGGKLYKALKNQYGNFVSAIRQDITNKKVYGIINLQLPEDILLYDFSLQVGDTFKSRPIINCDSITIIDAIDSIQINGQYRKVLRSGSVSLIEGIGSSNGLFEYNCFETSAILCKFENGLDNYDINCTPLIAIDDEINQVDIFISNRKAYIPRILIGGELIILNQQSQVVASLHNVQKEIVNIDFIRSRGIYFLVYRSAKRKIVKKVFLN